MHAVIARTRRSAASMRGISLVELMVGIAVGLFIVAAAAMMTSGQLSDNRKLLLETQVQQDLRATLDMVVRDIRRSGGWDEARRTIPSPSAPTIEGNPINYLILPTGGTSGPFYYNYGRASGMVSFGFLLSDGVLKGCVDALQASGCAAGWQDITDSNTLVITKFEVLSTNADATDNHAPLQMTCPELCIDPITGATADPTTAAATACWPSVSMRELIVTLEGHSKYEPTISRSMTARVRLRNLVLNVSSDVPSGQACPASP